MTTCCNTQEIELMTDLRKLDVSWNPTMALMRSDDQLFANLPHFEHLTMRAWDEGTRTEAEVHRLASDRIPVSRQHCQLAMLYIRISLSTITRC